MISGKRWPLLTLLLFTLRLAAAAPVETAASKPPVMTDTPASTAAAVRTRLAEQLLRSPPSVNSVRRAISEQRADGSWPDVPYDRRDRSIWPPQKHLTRLTSLATAFRAGPLRGDTALKATITRGLEFWLRRDPQSDNWWHNVIAAPQELGRFLVLMRDDLPPADVALACDRVRRSRTDRMTGTNLAWTAGNLFVLGAVTDDLALMRDELALITGTIRLTSEEGVQPDWSYHQHGPQLNAGNYGQGFLDTCVPYGELVRGTALAFTPEQLGILSQFALNFQDWVVWGQRMDLSSCGRQLDRPDAPASKAADLARTCARLAMLDPAHAPALNNFSDRATGRLPDTAAGAPTGNRCFWRSDFMVHRPGTWYASIKTYSSRILRTETSVNAENYKGYHLCDGVMLVAIDGGEYAEIQPVWDWRKLPGITWHETTAPLPYGKSAGFEHNPRDFVGGASDGEVGVAALDLAKENLTAKKAWFCFRNGIVCLGAGISSAAPEPAYTDVNQCLLRGEASILAGGSWRPASARQELLPATQAIYHDRIGYLFLAPTSATLTCGPQSGAWSELRKEGVTPAKITRDVFNLWIQHGPHPQNARYAYAVMPDVDPSSVALAAGSPPWHVLVNTVEVQAVESPGDHLVEAVFYEPGRLEKGGLPAIAAGAPCTLIVRAQVGGNLDLTASDPTQKLSSLRFTVDGRYDGPGCRATGGSTEVAIPLPSAGLAGSSVTVHLAAVPKLARISRMISAHAAATLSQANQSPNRP